MDQPKQIKKRGLTDSNGSGNKRFAMNKRDTRFFKVWRNKVLLKIIFYFSRWLTVNSKCHLSIQNLINLKPEHREYLGILYLEDSNISQQQPQQQQNQQQQQQQQPAILPVSLIPQTVTNLHIKTQFQLETKDIPANVKYVSFGKRSNQFVHLSCIPLKIEMMKFSLTTTVVVSSPPPLLPQQSLSPPQQTQQPQQPFKYLKKVVISPRSQSLLQHHHLLPNLSTLVIRKLVNPKSVIIPSSVTSLFFTSEFKGYLPSIPSTVTSISIGSGFKDENILDSLPSSLESIIMDTPKLRFEIVEHFKRFRNLKRLSFFAPNKPPESSSLESSDKEATIYNIPNISSTIRAKKNEKNSKQILSIFNINYN